MYPTEVNINEKGLEKLIATYKRAYKDIVNEITTATDFGVYHRKQLLAQIEGILTDLGENTQKFIEDELPQYYAEGAKDAVKQLNAIDAPVRVGSGFSRIHQEAIKALIDETAKAFGESISGVNRSANILLNKGVKEEITQRLAQGQIKGEALRQVKNSVAGAIQQQGLDALVDKGGHSWTLDRYSEMLIRTKAVEARNTGLGNRMVENGYDLVQVSSHGAVDVCGKWEGQVLSFSGATRGYPTVAQAENDGLFHPNCKHAINAIHMDIARETMAWNTETQQYEKGLIKPTKKTPPKGTPPKGTPPAPKAPIQPTTMKMTFVNNEVQLNSLETKIAKDTNLKIIELQGRTANRVYGQYNPTFNTIGYGKATATRSVEHNMQTFYHEIGHMVDNHALPKDIVQRTYAGVPTNHKIANFLSKQPEFIEAIAPYKYDIIETRLKRGNDNWQKLDKETIKTVILGGKVPVEGTTNRYYYLTPAHRKYMRSASEMFAEAYGQYRTEPALTKKTMPKLFDYFEKLGGAK